MKRMLITALILSSTFAAGVSADAYPSAQLLKTAQVSGEQPNDAVIKFDRQLLDAANGAVTAAYETPAASASQPAPVFDAQSYVILRNIEARIAELNMKLSTPQVQGCSDGEHIYTQGMRVTKGNVPYRCDLSEGNYKWTVLNYQ